MPRMRTASKAYRLILEQDPDTEEKLAQLSRRRQDRVDIATANFEAAKAKLEKDVGVAEQYADQEPVDTTALAAEVTNAEEMRKHLNEYRTVHRPAAHGSGILQE